MVKRRGRKRNEIEVKEEKKIHKWMKIYVFYKSEGDIRKIKKEN